MTYTSSRIVYLYQDEGIQELEFQELMLPSSPNLLFGSLKASIKGGMTKKQIHQIPPEKPGENMKGGSVWLGTCTDKTETIVLLENRMPRHNTVSQQRVGWSQEAATTPSI